MNAETFDICRRKLLADHSRIDHAWFALVWDAYKDFDDCEFEMIVDALLDSPSCRGRKPTLADLAEAARIVYALRDALRKRDELARVDRERKEAEERALVERRDPYACPVCHESILGVAETSAHLIERHGWGVPGVARWVNQVSTPPYVDGAMLAAGDGPERHAA